MLTVEFVSDKNELENAFQILNVEKIDDVSNFVLYEENVPIGIAQFKLENIVKMVTFVVRQDKKEKGIEDFFFRSLLFKMSFCPYVLQIDTVDKELQKFGFEQKNGKMELQTKNVVFPSDCGHQH